MTQPNYAVPPNPQLAEALRNANIPPNWKNGLAFRDYMVNAFENGVPQEQGLQHFDGLINKMSFALWENIVLLASHDQLIKGIGELG